MRFTLNKFLLVTIITLTSLLSFGQNCDQSMEKLIQEKRVYNLNHNSSTGYRIQIYNGTSETRARSILGNFSAAFPEINTRLFFEQPEWKVQVGNYQTKLEAHKDLQKIRQEFATAFLLKAKIKL